MGGLTAMEPEEVAMKMVQLDDLAAERTLWVPFMLTLVYVERKSAVRSEKPMNATQWNTVRGRSVSVDGHGAVKAVLTDSESATFVVMKSMLFSLTSGREGGRRSRMRIDLGSSPRQRRCCTIQPPTSPGHRY